MDRFTCASCGARYLIMPEGEEKMKRGFFARLFGRGKREFEASRPWQPTVAQPTMAPQAVARPPAQHDPVMTRHVQLPLAQARISGFFAAWLPTAIVAIIIIWTKTGGWWWAAVPTTFAVSALALSGFFWYRLYVPAKALWIAERLVGVDLDGDGSVGEPKTTIVDFTDRKERRRYKVELPVTDGVMAEIACAMLESDGRYRFSRRDMRAKTSVSDDGFEKLQKEFLRRGWAAYRKEGKPNSGVELLAAGRAVLRGYL